MPAPIDPTPVVRIVLELCAIVFGSLALCMLLAWASVIVSGRCSDEEQGEWEPVDIMRLVRRTVWRIEIFLRIVGRKYDCLPDSFRIDPGLAWTFAKILAGDGEKPE